MEKRACTQTDPFKGAYDCATSPLLCQLGNRLLDRINAGKLGTNEKTRDHLNLAWCVNLGTADKPKISRQQKYTPALRTKPGCQRQKLLQCRWRRSQLRNDGIKRIDFSMQIQCIGTNMTGDVRSIDAQSLLEQVDNFLRQTRIAFKNTPANPSARRTGNSVRYTIRKPITHAPLNSMARTPKRWIAKHKCIHMQG